jgi:hypothetical protein
MISSHHHQLPFFFQTYFRITLYKNELPFVSLAKTQKRLDRFEYLFFSFVCFNTGVV